MKILVNGRNAVLKKNFSFEYISENRLFMGRDGYTLSIALPLAGCPENVEIFGNVGRMDVDKPKEAFSCVIMSRDVVLAGSLTVVKVSPAELECQFSEGKCEQTATDPFSDVYINKLDLGSYPPVAPSGISPADAWATGNPEVCLPWINKEYATVPNNWVRYVNGEYRWHEDVTALSWMPYLVLIAGRICEAVGYTYDFSVWENSRYRLLLCCNVLPASWECTGYAEALPSWTVTEFFEKLELLMMCEFEFDHVTKSVTMRFTSDVLAGIDPVRIDKVVDEYSVEVSSDSDSNCEYLGAKRLAYKDCSHERSQYYSCDWYIARNPEVNSYTDTLSLVSAYRYRNDEDGFGWPDVVRELGYDEETGTYFCTRFVGSTKVTRVSDNRSYWKSVLTLQPVNVFGSGTPESDDIETVEIEFVPPCIRDTYVDDDDDMGYMLVMDPSVGSDEDLTEDSTGQEGAASEIERGEPDSSDGYYDEVYVAFWNGTVNEVGASPSPYIDSVFVSEDWKVIRVNPEMSLRLYGKDGSMSHGLQKIEPSQKFKFSWLGDTIPNPRAIFYVRGKRYLCEKITATFTENGMSQLLTGEFYPLTDSD